jgi:hypothetical protein
MTWKKGLILPISLLCILSTHSAHAEDIEVKEVYFTLQRECASPEERNKLKEAVLTCTKNGNNMSDEEMEDVIVQCEATFRRIICPEKEVLVFSLYDGTYTEGHRIPTEIIPDLTKRVKNRGRVVIEEFLKGIEHAESQPNSAD